MSDLSRITARTRYLLVDFDGPICSVFAGAPATSVAAQLRQLLESEGMTWPPEALSEPDPLALLRHASDLGVGWTGRVEEALREAETTAVRTAAPTPQAHEVLSACQQTGRKVAVVSNNSRAAVETYLAAQDLEPYVNVVAARTKPDPHLMKPSPHLVLQAIRQLDAASGECTLVGDSVTDIHSAEAAGIRSIGYANKPGKRDRLTRAGANAIITSMIELAHAIAHAQILRA
jgi:HAD superfamily hydrolase (TIGR01662 family)